MRLEHVSITNCAGFDSATYNLPAIAIVRGRNRAGKSALAACLKYPFDGGHDEDMLTPGAESGEILIRLDNGGAVRATISRSTNKTTRSYQKPGERKWVAKREFIDNVASSLSYDPLHFLKLEDKQQVLELLQVLGPSLTVSDDELTAAIGDSGYREVGDDAPLSGLDRVDQLLSEKSGSGSLYDQRRELNVAATTLAHHAYEIERALPPPSQNPLEDGSWDKVAAQKQAELSNLDQEERAKIAEIGKLLQSEKDTSHADEIEAFLAVDADIDGQIKVLELRRQELKQNIRTAQAERIEAARTEVNTAVAMLRSLTAEPRAMLTREYATAQERHTEWMRTEGSRKEVETAKAEAARKSAASERLSAALERLRALRTKIAERIPIKDALIKDGRLLNLKGVPFRKWNTEAQYGFCLRLAVLTHGELGLVVMDGCEVFDAEHTAALLRACDKYVEKEGMQFVLLTVGQGELTVTGEK